MIAMLLMSAAISQAAPKIPHLDGETRLLRVKANPDKYLGKTFVICGGLQVSDYYNYSYRDQEKSFYSLGFVEAGETFNDFGDHCQLYMSKTAISKELSESIIETVTKAEEAKRNTHKLARLKVAINPVAFSRDKQWDMLEVMDIQFINKDKTGWSPWIFEEFVKAARAKEDAENKAEMAKKAEAEAAQLRQEKAREKAQWREWSDPDGGKVYAKYSGSVAGTVKLTKRDGSTVKIPFKKLPEEEQQWIEKKLWLKAEVKPQ